jgi:hypothetical protein
MPAQSGPEQRKYPRVNLNMPVLIVGRDGHWVARMINVSLGGCQLEGEVPTRVGDILAVACGPKDSVEGFRAKVVWAAPRDPILSFGGLFWGADEEKRRMLVHKLITLAHPEDAAGAHRLIG